MIKLMKGDAIEKMKTIPGGSVHLVLTDPPYGTTACVWDNVIPLMQMWRQVLRITKPNSAIVFMANQPFTTELIKSNINMFKYCWVWIKNKKTGFLNAKFQPLRQTEDLVVFSPGKPVFNPKKTEGHKPVNSYTKHTGDGDTVGTTQLGFTGGGQTDRFPTNVLYFDVVNNDNSHGNKYHPTQKPVALMEYIIQTYTNEGDTVLDFTMGSGTTGVACVNLNRSFIGIENVSKYFNISKRRILKGDK